VDNVKNYENSVTFVYLFIILRFPIRVKPQFWDILLNSSSVYHARKMKKVLLVLSTLFLVTPVSAAEITSKITDSIQLGVQGAAIQTERVGASYSVSGTNIDVTTLGGVGGAGSYGINTNGQAFTFSETSRDADTAVTTQSVSAGTIASPNLYGNSTTQLGGNAGTLAGTLSGTGVPTVTAGGPGTTATAQRSIELSVFK
jgi:hypothetical protein